MLVLSCQRWFNKFRSGDLSLQENDRSGRPSKIDNDVLRSMLENNPHLTSREIAEEFGCWHTTIGDHIKSLGHNVEPFLNKLIITEDEKWILYENIKRKKSYCKPGTLLATVPKPSIHHQRKVLLCLWWDRKGPVYYELLKQGKTINADLYCNPLDKLNAAIKGKRPALASRKGIVFHHDNARPHTAMVTLQKLNALGWLLLRLERIPPFVERGGTPLTSKLWIRSLKPLKTHRVEETLYIKSVEIQSPPVGVEWNFGEWSASSGAILVT
ncbi:histone-lysine N-methyltransferase SETMAR [Trichonephila clavipes]|uniref:Histone-lysine N-methyltransferase SETMAR n=1 Tax=Trichonephila clavipes TaxID=2585209 RepID=A0A8X6WI84_TRICX|nr:histone-lysine N-methyltransferase SETMAR [Trichonephila clavipes]